MTTVIQVGDHRVGDVEIADDGFGGYRFGGNLNVVRAERRGTRDRTRLRRAPPSTAITNSTSPAARIASATGLRNNSKSPLSLSYAEYSTCSRPIGLRGP